MKWMYRLERKLGRNFGIPNFMIYLTATQLAVYVLGYFFRPQIIVGMAFIRTAITHGQIWRVLTFLLLPPAAGNFLFLLLALYVAYHIGISLEDAWGTTLFTLYYIFGAVGAILAGFVSGIGTNSYIYLSMFLAFAYLYPDTTFMLFFLLPVKAKWLAWANWALYIFLFITGGFYQRMAIIFSLANFFLFFGPDVWNTMKGNYKSQKRRREYKKNWNDQNPWR